MPRRHRSGQRNGPVAPAGEPCAAFLSGRLQSSEASVQPRDGEAAALVAVGRRVAGRLLVPGVDHGAEPFGAVLGSPAEEAGAAVVPDRTSTRLNSSN